MGGVLGDRHEGGRFRVSLTIPDAVPAEDNATGTRMALANLAAYVEGGTAG